MAGVALFPTGGRVGRRRSVVALARCRRRLAGFFIVPVVGLPIGGALGIYVGEYFRPEGTAHRLAATVATLRGFGLAALAQSRRRVHVVLWFGGWVALT